MLNATSNVGWPMKSSTLKRSDANALRREASGSSGVLDSARPRRFGRITLCLFHSSGATASQVRAVPWIPCSNTIGVPTPISVKLTIAFVVCFVVLVCCWFFVLFGFVFGLLWVLLFVF